MTHYSPVVSSSASLKALSHAAHLSYCIVAGLGIDPWVEHAESKANIADIPSHMRTSRSHHQQRGFPEIDLVESTAYFPPPGGMGPPDPAVPQLTVPVQSRQTRTLLEPTDGPTVLWLSRWH